MRFVLRTLVVALAALAIGAAVAPSIASAKGPCGVFQKTECSASGERTIPGGGKLRVAFWDAHHGPGRSTWTLDYSRASVRFYFNGPIAPGNIQMRLHSEICFSQYGFGSVSVGGGIGLSAGTESSCASGDFDGRSDVRHVTVDHGSIVGRGNSYGRWLWVSHKVTGVMRLYDKWYTVEAYRRTGPTGGTV
jgi:hypothetical protein